MREIKFRGKVPEQDAFDGGRTVYGSLVVYADGMYKTWINPLEGDRNYPVEPESVSQLIGTDKYGNEIYEGDEITIGGKTYAASFEDFAAIRSEEVIKCAK